MFASAAIFEVANEEQFEVVTAKRESGHLAPMRSEEDFLRWLSDELDRQRADWASAEEVEFRIGIFE